MKMKKIYLDYAAATPLEPQVLEAMKPYFFEKFYNPSAGYLAARAAKNELDNIRSRVAMVVGARPAEIVFTAGATEANNLAIQGVMGQYPESEILVSSIEHESVLGPAGLFTRKQIPVDERGIIKLNLLSNLITDKTVMLSVMLVSNELGTIQPLADISRFIQTIRRQRRAANNTTPLYLHTDAAQAPNFLDLQAARLGVDLISLNGGKIYGPKQSGALYVKAGQKLRPIIVGGGQEFGLRSGTENLAAAAGFCRALELASQNRAKETKRILDLRDFFEELLKQKLPAAALNGSNKKRAPHILSVTIPGTDNERLMMELDERGVECAVGSACSAGSGEPSHVLAAIGLSTQQIRSSLRFSLGKYTSRQDIRRAVDLLAKLTPANR